MEAVYRKFVRHYENNLDADAFADLARVLDGEQWAAPEFGQFAAHTLDAIAEVARLVVSKSPPALALHEPTLYAGGAGIALFLYHAWSRLQALAVGDGVPTSLRQRLSADADSYLAHAHAYATQSVEALRRPHDRGTFRWEQVEVERGPSVFCGQAGIYLVAALVAHARQDHTGATALLKEFVRLGSYLLRDDGDDPASGICEDEVLYGRAGYLLGAVYLYRELGDDAAHPTITAILRYDFLEALVDQLIRRGAALAEQLTGRRRILLYPWHDHLYLGYAHGLMGILSALFETLALPGMPAPTEQQAQLLQRTLEWVYTQHDGRGYYNSRVRLRPAAASSSVAESNGRDTKRLVQWCHGSPGAVFLCSSALCLDPDDARPRQEAVLAAEVVWREGLLRKGPGLCHGIGGNAYALLRCYVVAAGSDAQRRLWLQRALAYAAFLTRYRGVDVAAPHWLFGPPGTHIPDRPYSLYEGAAGFGCLLVDLLCPRHARLPPC